MGRKYKVGYEGYDKNGQKFTIIGKSPKISYWIIQFENGKIQETRSDHITRSTTDLNGDELTVLGIAKHGNVRPKDYPTLYNRWLLMLGRCFNQNDVNYKYYGANGTTVSSELLVFENYVNVLKGLENFDNLINDPDNWVIDKDLKSGDEKIYSSNTLSIIQKQDNLKIELEEHKQPVIQFSLNGDYIAKYNSIKEAAEIVGANRSGISMAINGQIGSTGGYIWRRYNGEN